VSLNLLDFTVTPMHAAWRVVGEEALRSGTRVIGSELVGLVPLAALRDAGRAALGGASAGASDITLVEAAVDALRLDAIHPFDPRQRVLEWAIEDAGQALTAD
jgi:glutamate formiminotransferase/formiminotetrahydrofolate cyclodeaminase